MPPKIKNIRKKQRKIIKDMQDDEKDAQDIIREQYEALDIDDDAKVKEFEFNKELFEHKISKEDEELDYLYPDLNDPNFNIKIAEKKEFFDNKYDGKIVDEDGNPVNIVEKANQLCNLDFELAPHQLFIRNFLSFQTPYNSLLLYHGLGSGKTCSAISVAEEMRDYLNQMGIDQEIIVVASPNVQDNFKLQLFDERKLEEIDGLWNIKSCTGNKFLKEINPMNMKGLSKDKVISQINQIIRNNYEFKGYIEFANYIRHYSNVEGDMDEKKRQRISRAKLNKHFSNRLIIIDEVHNIRFTEENRDKRAAVELFKLVENVENLRLLLLSATPMYNSFKEIIWLLNLMNLNDKRSTIEISDIFNANGSFKTDEHGNEVGRELLERKATGYISFVRGENPFTFPYRIWPSLFSPRHSLLNSKTVPDDEVKKVIKKRKKVKIDKSSSSSLKGGNFNSEVQHPASIQYNLEPLNEDGLNPQIYHPAAYRVSDNIQVGGFKYPSRQLNGKPISQEIEILDLYLTKIGDYQSKGYQYIINSMKSANKTIINKKGVEYELPNFENMEKFGYTMLQSPIMALNIVFPDKRLEKLDLDEEIEDSFASDLIGGSGLNRIMTYETIVNPPSKRNFKYKSNKYEKIFAPEHIGKYSSKIKSMCDSIKNSTGIVLIYSEYIDGGIVPVALALEEMGFSRYGSVNSLFETPPTKPIDAIEFKTREEMKAMNKPFRPAHYIMISGDRNYSPDNMRDLKALTDKNNINGEMVKVVLITLAGAEGLDFKNVRQVHVMEPWYNMNRIEQIIGRAVRNCSHKDLPFIERNVLIYLYGTKLDNKKEEAADLYVYRLAQLKALQIGRVSRILKEISVDCILNYEQLNFIENRMNINVKQSLSNQKLIDFDVGDKSYSSACDYMKTCDYVCRPDKLIPDGRMDTYNETFIFMNTDKIIQRIRLLFKEKHFYTKEHLIAGINILKEYPLTQINAALTQLVEDKTEYISDEYGRLGNLVNIGNLYLFQPLELTNERISLYDRSAPVQYKHDNLKFLLPEKLTEVIIDKPEHVVDELSERVKVLIEKLEIDYLNAKVPQQLEKGEEDWYKHCSVVIQKLQQEDFDRSLINKFIVDHIAEMLDYEDTMILLNYLYSTPNRLTELLSGLKDYYDSHMLKARKINGLYLQNSGIKQLIVLNDGKWSNAEAEDVIDLNTEISKLIVPNKSLGHVIGFISSFKKNYMIFKVKDMEIKRKNAGARCDQQGKSVSIKMLNKILENETYNNENTKDMIKSEICIRQEFMLRLFDEQKRNGKRWMLTPIEAILLSEKEKVL